ncbi:MAG: translation initiation factor SUI1 [Sulfuricurvum sp. RIFOXYD2_FULL_44_160]|uniref:Translation initiation factor n=1 Tax=Sulfuricurvum kujiense TaxID=148813 RepID=A0A2D3WR63_9BACT|nr:MULTISPECIES: translation initiation factor [Sulfuricurvum]OHD91452.1 MAG: translation initiation factor SUI1 [Sulfuricurvum sp. RIFOXYD12_FULL_44_77]OHD93972.1 MAG: translation initiation factor SUI1 [Sulfuricurvum sp. RIFOXYD2_FULL_44_160]DAB39213.1 MAG TPA: translation initiation factor [Sulfuricurvum kujiense]
MSRGTKLSLDLGASWGEGWSMEEEKTVKVLTILEPSAHRLVFQKEKRKGKAVTLVGPFSLSEEDAHKTLSSLKKSLACGGAYKEQWMEFQGDIAPKVREHLEKLSFKFKNPK